ncbi:MAG TPA: DUF433 domain-containing protein [Planctomycetota bacterium]|jgi:uncharacterized protein (DUF433 family)|nr:DUF433 domain-containing protein [Planctomycetota bacterium]
MEREEVLKRISIDPRVCGGRPVVRGTRVWVSLVLDNLAAGMTEKQLLREYPQLTHADVLACLAYAAEVARERVVPIPTRRSG